MKKKTASERARRKAAEILRAVWSAALAASDPAAGVRGALEDDAIRETLLGARRIGVFAVGKAAAAMLEGARSWKLEGLAVLPAGYPAPRLPGIEILRAAHPEADRTSVAAARRALAFFSSFHSEDALLCLVSGGTSSLLALPRPGLSLGEKRAAIRRLARSGASIVELNRLRTRLSAVKGGRLGRTTAARLVTLVLSDVPNDAASVVGSGPTIRRRARDVVRIVGSNRLGIEAAVRAAARAGIDTRTVRQRLSGEARESGRRFVRRMLAGPPGVLWVAGGETTVRIRGRSGRGGRTLEFALGAAEALDGGRPATLLAAASDGWDGNSEAAGAFADETTVSRARDRGLDLLGALGRHDTEPLLASLGDLLLTGPTGTNVGDWAFGIAPKTPV